MTTRRVRELSVRDARQEFAATINEASARGAITYLTSRGRRIAAIVPLAVADAAVEQDAHDQPPDA